jgi:phage tail-like protein
LMWRYLMVFDRVWTRYDELLANQSSYFDPHLAPANFKAWLAAVVGLDWLSRFSAASQSGLLPKLMPHIVNLYQKRGTRQGLQKYLQICLGIRDEDVQTRIKIEENLVGNFILSDAARLSDDLILGCSEDEVGHFTVVLHWPEPAAKLDETLIHEIIRSWKPAHTTYELYSFTG